MTMQWSRFSNPLQSNVRPLSEQEFIGSDDPRIVYRASGNRALVLLADDGLYYVFLPAFGGGYRWTYAERTLRAAKTEANRVARDLAALARSTNPRLSNASRSSILHGMAKGPWSDWWAREREEEGESFSGMDIYDLAPEPPREAKQWAEQVARQIEFMNGPLTDLYRLAEIRGYPNDAEHFGVDLGLQVAGHGVSYCDDMPAGNCKLITLPHREFYL